MKTNERFQVKGPWGMNLAVRPARMDAPKWLTPRPPARPRQPASEEWAEDMARLVDVIDSSKG